MLKHRKLRTIFYIGALLGPLGAFGDGPRSLVIDQVAAEAQAEAASLLEENLRASKKGSSVRFQLLLRLSYLLEQRAKVVYRVEQGEALLEHRDLSKKDKDHLNTLARLDEVLTFLITEYPKHQKRSSFYLRRGRTRQESEKDALAKADFEVILKRFSGDESYRQIALKELSTIAWDKGRFEEVVKRIDALGIKDESKDYPLLMIRLAWSLFHTKKYDRCVKTVEDFLAFARKKDGEAGDSKFKNMIETVLMDSSEFYLGAFEFDSKKYTLENALIWFHKISDPESFEFKDELVLRYFKLLHSRGYEKSSLSWWKITFEKYPNYSAVQFMIFRMLEQSFKMFRLNEVKENIVRLNQVFEKTKTHFQTDKALQSLLYGAGAIQKSIQSESKRAGALESGLMKQRNILILVLNSYVLLSPKVDAQTFKVLYNLSNVYLSKNDLDGAVNILGKITDLGKKVPDELKKAGLKQYDAALRAIQIGYDDLVSKKKIPNVVDPKKIYKERPFDSEISRWEGWIKEFEDEYDEGLSDLQTYSFELSRVMVSFGKRNEALNRLDQVVLLEGNDKIRQTASQFAIDLRVNQGQWSQNILAIKKYLYSFDANEENKDILKYVGILKKSLHVSRYKVSENLMSQKDFQAVLDQFGELESSFKETLLYDQWLLLAIDASTNLKNKNKFFDFSDRYIERNSKNKTSTELKQTLGLLKLIDADYEESYVLFSNVLDQRISKNQRNYLESLCSRLLFIVGNPELMNAEIGKRKLDRTYLDELKAFQTEILVQTSFDENSADSLEKRLLKMTKTFSSLSREVQLIYLNDYLSKFEEVWSEIRTQLAGFKIESERLEETLVKRVKAIKTIERLASRFSGNKSIEPSLISAMMIARIYGDLKDEAENIDALGDEVLIPLTKSETSAYRQVARVIEPLSAHEKWMDEIADELDLNVNDEDWDWGEELEKDFSLYFEKSHERLPLVRQWLFELATRRGFQVLSRGSDKEILLYLKVLPSFITDKKLLAKIEAYSLRRFGEEVDGFKKMKRLTSQRKLTQAK